MKNLEVAIWIPSESSVPLYFPKSHRVMCLMKEPWKAAALNWTGYRDVGKHDRIHAQLLAGTKREADFHQSQGKHGISDEAELLSDV
jgi:hypothetical protein